MGFRELADPHGLCAVEESFVCDRQDREVAAVACVLELGAETLHASGALDFEIDLIRDHVRTG